MAKTIESISYIKLGENEHPIDAVSLSGKTIDDIVIFEPGGGDNSAKLKGSGSTASGNMSIAEGNDTNATGQMSHAEGYDTTAEGYAAHSEGQGTYAKGSRSHAEGSGTSSIGEASHSEGASTTATGPKSHAEGTSTSASGSSAHAEGYLSEASGNASHSEGNSRAIEAYAHAEGRDTVSGGYASHSEGSGTQVWNSYGHAEGYYTTSLNANEHAEGRYNKSNQTSSTFGNAGNTIHSIGIGADGSNRKNAFEVMQNGDAYLYGVGGYNGNVDFSQLQPDMIYSLQTILNLLFNKQLHSFPQGKDVVTNGSYSNAFGLGTITNNAGECACGMYNHSIQDGVEGSGTQFSVGVGTNVDRKNAIEITMDGEIYIYGLGGYNGTNPHSSMSLQTLLRGLFV